MYAGTGLLIYFFFFCFSYAFFLILRFALFCLSECFRIFLAGGDDPHRISLFSDTLEI